MLNHLKWKKDINNDYTHTAHQSTEIIWWGGGGGGGGGEFAAVVVFKTKGFSERF